MSERKEYPSATATIQAENERVRVTRWTFPPNTATGWHTHGHDYVVVPTMSGKLLLVSPDGAENTYDMVAGESYFRKAGVEHNVVNPGPGTVEFVETELLE
ncbi:MAG: beta-alanine degradation protein BauB [Rhizobiaceae bacterium MnEN-MB40S]|nr:MAG: beta-alanine degradation protein BauB [Rhizobiaceae bacterium MnEN-MB40S]